MVFRRISLMSDVESAFLAGLFEGDGCIYLREQPKCRGSYFYGMHITCKDKAIVDFVYATTGVGSVRISTNSKRTGTYWRWEVTKHKDVSDLIQRLYPYLIIKKRRAELLYKMGTLLRDNMGMRLTLGEVERRAAIFDEFKSLQGHQPIENGGEFGGNPERTIPSQAPDGEGVEVSPEIKDISAAPEMEDMTRATEESVEAELR